MPARPSYEPRRGLRQAGAERDVIIDLRDHPRAQQPGAYRRHRVRPGRVDSADLTRPAQLRTSRVFGSPAFRRLWFSQVASSLGDWIGLFAITAIATRVGGSDAARFGGVSLVLSARLIPGFFLAPFAGVLVDRWNRKTIMVMCDFGRAAVICTLPFVDTLFGLVLASLALELLTLLWSPAKEASVPNLVRREFLPTANSLSLAAAYGTIPLAAAVFALLVKLPEWLDSQIRIGAARLSDESVALYFDAFTYLVSAAVIATLVIPHHARQQAASPSEVATPKTGGFSDARDGWRYIRTNARVRSVIIGLSTGLIGGAMIIPLGARFADVGLRAGAGGYGLLLTAMGSGVAVGVVGLGLLQKRLPVDRAFVIALFGAGACLFGAASMTSLGGAVACVAGLGLFAGASYVLGFTSVQVNSEDHVRGRVFATLYTLTRFCIVVALTAAPLLSLLFGQISAALVGGQVSVGRVVLDLSGVRLTLWVGSLILIGGGMLASRTLRRLDGGATAPTP